MNDLERLRFDIMELEDQWEKTDARAVLTLLRRLVDIVEGNDEEYVIVHREWNQLNPPGKP